MKDRFPRRCDATGVGMHAGFVVYDGEHHFSEEKYLIEFLRKAYNADESKDSDASLLEQAFANEDYYYTEWDIDDCDYWYERSDYGHLLLYTAQESAMRDIYVLYDQEKDRVYQREDGIIVYYLNFSSAFYWEGELNNSEGAKYKYDSIEASYLPAHQIQRLYNQIKKKS